MKKIINRREFLQRLGMGSAAVAAAATLPSCISAPKPSEEGDFNPKGGPFSEDQLGEMTYRVNPANGDKVSILGYGCMRFPQRTDGQKGPDGNDLDQEKINELIKYAMDHGVNYYDTSPAYLKGFSERSVGIALKATGRPRESYYIATKLSNFAVQQQTREASQEMLCNSLKYLQTDYIDYLLLHSIGGGGMANFNRRYMDNGILDWLVEQKQKGVIRNLGFSFHGEAEVFETMLKWHDEGKYHWDFVQIQMNYLDWNNGDKQEGRSINAEWLYDELDKREIPVVIMEPLLGGRLSNLPNHVIAHLKARLPEMSAASWAFRFCGTYPRVLSALSGMTYMEHLQDNLRSFSPLVPLTQEELDYLEGAAKQLIKYPLIPCNDCKYCMPCPYGLDIPGIFVHYNKCVNEGVLPGGEEDANYSELRRNYLISYNRAIPTLRQADHCINCNQCSPHCPQNIRIPQQLEKIAASIEQLKRKG